MSMPVVAEIADLAGREPDKNAVSLHYYEQFSDIENAIRREKAIDEMEPHMEDTADRERQSELERPVSTHCKPLTLLDCSLRRQ
jgi:hypothetical protein